MRRPRVTFGTALSLLACVAVLLAWWRSQGVEDHVRWRRYPAGERWPLVSREIQSHTRRGGIWLYDMRATCDPSTAVELPVPADWDGVAGLECASGRVDGHAFGPSSSVAEQCTFARVSGGHTTAMIWGRRSFRYAAVRIPLWPLVARSSRRGRPARRDAAVRIPLWPLVGVTGFLPLRHFVRRTRASGWRRRGLCQACGYDVRGIAGRCPECGTATR